MSEPLHIQAKRRNARFRAWQGLGVPVEGRWWSNPGGEWRLSLTCGCGFWPLHPARWCGLRFGALDLEREERLILREAHRRKGWFCEHFSRLLGAEPPELGSLAELELLAELG
jgi:hypothetical protein